MWRDAEEGLSNRLHYQQSGEQSRAVWWQLAGQDRTKTESISSSPAFVCLLIFLLHHPAISSLTPPSLIF